MLNKGTVKEFKTYDEQLQILIDRGLRVNDREKAIGVLRRLNYYRFSAYSLTLRRDDVFYDGVSFDDICELYSFDEGFRQIVFKYSCHIEVFFRSYIAYYHSGKYGPLGYLDAANFSSISYHSKFLVELDKEVERSDDVFIEHHRKDLNGVYPLWAVIEVASYGVLSKLFKNMLKEDRAAISRNYVGRGRKYVENWLQCCTYCRNVAAHGGRFYNRSLKSLPVRLDPKTCAGIDNTSPFAFVVAIHHLLPDSAMRSELIEEISALYGRYSFALPKHMGFPGNWKEILSQ